MTSGRPLVSMASGFVGVLAGGALMLVIPAWRQSPPPAQAHAAEALPPSAPTIIVQRVEAPAASALPPASSATKGPAAARLSLDQVRAHREDDHADRLARHDAEPPSDWGAEADREFRDDLERLASKASFRFDDIDCRTDTCLANIEFSDMHASRTGWIKVAAAPYENNCGTEVWIDPSNAAPDAPRHASVLFDCTNHSKRP